MNNIILCKCPKCGKNQKTQPSKKLIDSRKRCVYCGKSFRVYKNVNDNTIVKIIK